MKQGEWEIGHGALGIGHWEEFICYSLLPHLPYLPHLPHSPLPHSPLPTPLFNKVPLIASWTRQGSRVRNFFQSDKNVVDVTATVADSRCHPN